MKRRCSPQTRSSRWATASIHRPTISIPRSTRRPAITPIRWSQRAGSPLCPNLSILPSPIPSTARGRSSPPPCRRHIRRRWALPSAARRSTKPTTSTAQRARIQTITKTIIPTIPIGRAARRFLPSPPSSGASPTPLAALWRNRPHSILPWRLTGMPSRAISMQTLHRWTSGHGLGISRSGMPMRGSMSIIRAFVCVSPWQSSRGCFPRAPSGRARQIRLQKKRWRGLISMPCWKISPRAHSATTIQALRLKPHSNCSG